LGLGISFPSNILDATEVEAAAIGKPLYPTGTTFLIIQLRCLDWLGICSSCTVWIDVKSVLLHELISSLCGRPSESLGLPGQAGICQPHIQDMWKDTMNKCYPENIKIQNAALYSLFRKLVERQMLRYIRFVPIILSEMMSPYIPPLVSGKDK